jgi:N-acyl-phosphatidylethanolamine-hydrolysing phospholipase D
VTAKGWRIASVLALLLAACSVQEQLPSPGSAAGGAPRTASGFANVSPFPPSAGRIERAGLWLRKIWTTVSPRGGAAERVDPSAAAMARNPSVTWVGHATFLVRMDGATFLTDPNFSEWAAPMAYTGPRRAVAPGVPLDALPRIDFVVLSHDHYDHADVPSLKRLAASGARFIVPLGVGDLVRDAGGQAVELDWWQHQDIGNVRVHCVPAQHHSGRGIGDAGRSLWAGWVVKGPSRSFYFAGDTGYTPSMKGIQDRLGSVDLAAIPIGAYSTPSPGPFLHTTPEEALQLAEDLGARRAVGMHFGTFDLSDEPLDEPPHRFRAEAQRRGLSDDQAWLMKVGETRSW